MFFPLTLRAQSLEKEVQDVKATLQSMLAQLKEEEGDDEEKEEEQQEEEELQDDDLMQNGTEDEEEDQYFSDSWDIWNGSPRREHDLGFAAGLTSDPLLYSSTLKAWKRSPSSCWKPSRQSFQRNCVTCCTSTNGGENKGAGNKKGFWNKYAKTKVPYMLAAWIIPGREQRERVP